MDEHFIMGEAEVKIINLLSGLLIAVNIMSWCIGNVTLY